MRSDASGEGEARYKISWIVETSGQHRCGRLASAGNLIRSGPANEHRHEQTRIERVCGLGVELGAEPVEHPGEE
jgi:hypothetical protein